MRAAVVGRKAAAEGGECGGATMWEKRWRGGLTGAEATKHSQVATTSDTAGRERTQEASDSAAAASDRAGRERGSGCGGARLRTWARSADAFMVRARRVAPGGVSVLMSGPAWRERG
jgi:hypothetical protein